MSDTNIIQDLIGQQRTILVYRSFIEITKDIRAALLLSQLWFWSPRTKNPEKWVYKTAKEFQAELGLNEYGLKKAKKILLELKLIDTKIYKANGVPTTHYRVKEDKLRNLLGSPNGIGDNDQIDLANNAKTINIDDKHKVQTSLVPNGTKSSADAEDCFLSDGMKEVYHQAEELNAFWKSVHKTGGHTSLQSKFWPTGQYDNSDKKVSYYVYMPITSAIRMEGLEKMKKAVENYKEFKDSADEWTPGANLSLAQFCHNRQYCPYLERVPPNPIKHTNPWDYIKSRFSPLTSAYASIFDPKTGRYYGFQTEKINSTIRWEDIDDLVTHRGTFTFDNFMELEWMIAGMLWRRKQNGDKELKTCEKYMRIWEKLIPEFKKEAKKWLKEDWELYG